MIFFLTSYLEGYIDFNKISIANMMSHDYLSSGALCRHRN